METTTVQMTPQELARYQAYQSEQATRQAKEKAKRDRDAYRELVDETITACIPTLQQVSTTLKAAKQAVIAIFGDVIEMKADVLRLKKDGQRSDTFTHTDGTKRITLGVYTTDGYRDTVEDGVAIVREVIESLASDDKTKALVKMVLRLLARDAAGTLKASRVVQLRRIAEEMGNERILEGVQIIEEAYQPAISRQYIKAEVKNETGAWVSIPLGMTEA